MKSAPRCFTLMAALALVASFSFAQDRGLTVAAKAVGGNDLTIGKQYAVLIAIDRYQNWTPLRNPVKDAKAIKEILQRRYYIDEFIELFDLDATAAGIRGLFDDLIKRIGPADSVLIYYAGHGYTDQFNVGYWIPVDGSTDMKNQDRWVANQQIRSFINLIKARSVAMLVDSCFSGDLLNATRGLPATPDSDYFRKALRYNARQVLTSGASESVPDESEFSRQLKLLLETNTEACLDPLAMFERIRRGVEKTIPLFGTLPGHEIEGSYVLFLRGASEPVSITPAVALKDAELLISLAGGVRNAEVYINGEKVGTAPGLLQKIPSGVPLALEVRSGLDAAKAELTLKSKELREIALRLERTKGQLFIEADESGVDVYLDGAKLGPLGNGLFRDLPAGDHRLELRGSGSYAAAPVTIPSDETVRIAVALAAAGAAAFDAAADVAITLSGNGLTRSAVGGGVIGDLPPGRYAVKASGPGYPENSSTVIIYQGSTARWTPYTTGTLTLRLQPSGASVTVGGRAAAFNSAGELILVPGKNQLTVSAPGYKEHRQEVTVAAGKTANLSIALKELDKASVFIAEPPFGATIKIGTLSQSVSAEGGVPVTLAGLPAGLPLTLSATVPCADSLASEYQPRSLTLAEGIRQTINLPTGYFTVPRLPLTGSLYLAPAGSRPPASPAAKISLQAVAGGYRSPLLATGSYTLVLYDPLAMGDGIIFKLPFKITGSASTELPGYLAAAFGTGTLVINAPADATIILDGNGIIRTISGSATIADLPAGSYSLKAGGPGYDAISTTLTVTRNGKTDWSPFTTGTILVSGLPAGANLSVDGQAFAPAIASINLPSGKHALIYRAAGYRDARVDLTVNLGKTERISVSPRLLDRASLTVTMVPAGTTVSVGDQTLTAQTDGTLSFRNLPAGVPLAISGHHAAAETVAFKNTITFEEGAAEMIALPVGTISIPYIPANCSLRFRPSGAPDDSPPVTVDLTPAASGGWSSANLPAGNYKVALYDPSLPRNKSEAFFPVAILAGKSAVPGGYMDYVRSSIQRNIDSARARIKAKTGLDGFAWIPFAIGLAGTGGAAAAYYLGGQARADYVAAEASVDVDAARAQVQLWSRVMIGGAAVGGVGFGTASLIWLTGPNPKALQASIDELDAVLRRLGN